MFTTSAIFGYSLIPQQLSENHGRLVFELNAERNRMGQRRHCRNRINFLGDVEGSGKRPIEEDHFPAMSRRVSSGKKGIQPSRFYVNRRNCTLIGREVLNYSTEFTTSELSTFMGQFEN